MLAYLTRPNFGSFGLHCSHTKQIYSKSITSKQINITTGMKILLVN